MLTVKDFVLRLPSHDTASVSLQSALLSTSCTHKQLAICLVNYSHAGLSLLRKEEMGILFFCVGTWQNVPLRGEADGISIWVAVMFSTDFQNSFPGSVRVCLFVFLEFCSRSDLSVKRSICFFIRKSWQWDVIKLILI